MSVVIPTWESGGFVEETLASVAKQDLDDFVVIISVDPSSDDTLEVCRDFARKDGRFRVIEQPEREGWVGNSNRGLDLVATPFFMFMPHDDILPPGYLSSLKSALEAHPAAVCAYPDMERFENISTLTHVDSLVGSPADRAAAWLRGPLGSLPFRGLTRSSILDDGLRLIEGPVDGIHADVLWVLELALAGDCIRVPGTVYRKRVRDGSVVRSWEATPLKAKRDGMVFHITEVAEAISRAGLSRRDERRLLQMSIRRLDRIPERWRPFTNADERARFHAEVLMATRERATGPSGQHSM